MLNNVGVLVAGVVGVLGVADMLVCVNDDMINIVADKLYIKLYFLNVSFASVSLV